MYKPNDKNLSKKLRILNIKTSTYPTAKTTANTAYSRTNKSTLSSSYMKTDPICQSNVKPSTIFQTKNHTNRMNDSFTLSFSKEIKEMSKQKLGTHIYNNQSVDYLNTTSGSLRTFGGVTGLSTSVQKEPNMSWKRMCDRHSERDLNIFKYKPAPEIKFYIRVKSKEKDITFGQPSEKYLTFNDKTNTKARLVPVSDSKQSAISKIFKSSVFDKPTKKDMKPTIKKPYKDIKSANYSFCSTGSNMKDLLSYKDGPNYKEIKVSSKVNNMGNDLFKKAITKSKITDIFNNSFHNK